MCKYTKLIKLIYEGNWKNSDTNCGLEVLDWGVLIDLDGCNIDDKKLAELLEVIEKHKELKESLVFLNLSNNKITQWTNVDLPNLKVLSLNNNQLTNVDLYTCENLQFVYISNNNKITEVKFPHPNNNNIEYIDVEGSDYVKEIACFLINKYKSYKLKLKVGHQYKDDLLFEHMKNDIKDKGPNLIMKENSLEDKKKTTLSLEEEKLNKLWEVFRDNFSAEDIIRKELRIDDKSNLLELSRRAMCFLDEYANSYIKNSNWLYKHQKLIFNFYLELFVKVNNTSFIQTRNIMLAYVSNNSKLDNTIFKQMHSSLVEFFGNNDNDYDYKRKIENFKKNFCKVANENVYNTPSITKDFFENFVLFKRKKCDELLKNNYCVIFRRKTLRFLEVFKIYRERIEKIEKQESFMKTLASQELINDLISTYKYIYHETVRGYLMKANYKRIDKKYDILTTLKVSYENYIFEGYEKVFLLFLKDLPLFERVKKKISQIKSQMENEQIFLWEKELKSCIVDLNFLNENLKEENDMLRKEYEVVTKVKKIMQEINLLRNCDLNIDNSESTKESIQSNQLNKPVLVESKKNQTMIDNIKDVLSELEGYDTATDRSLFSINTLNSLRTFNVAKNIPDDKDEIELEYTTLYEKKCKKIEEKKHKPNCQSKYLNERTQVENIGKKVSEKINIQNIPGESLWKRKKRRKIKKKKKKHEPSCQTKYLNERTQVVNIGKKVAEKNNIQHVRGESLWKSKKRKKVPEKTNTQPMKPDPKQHLDYGTFFKDIYDNSTIEHEKEEKNINTAKCFSSCIIL